MGISTIATANATSAVPSQYDQGDVDYLGYWAGRSYEHRAEVMALSRLLQGRRFGHAVDVGGGYGRLSVVLRRYADRVTLADPSSRQLEVAERYLDRDAAIETRLTWTSPRPASIWPLWSASCIICPTRSRNFPRSPG
jgi:ubiquinone/menaquinone biosynthesis C-methylase UbiE